jgi:hypothetical protein
MRHPQLFVWFKLCESPSNKGVVRAILRPTSVWTGTGRRKLAREAALDDDQFDPRWMHAAIPQHQWHFFRRVYQHYRLVLGPGDFSTMLRDIETGRSLKLQNLKGGKAIYFVVAKSVFERIYIVVSNQRHVITALPPTRKLKLMRLMREVEQGRVQFRIEVARDCND